MVRVWPQCGQAVGGPRDKIWDFVLLLWTLRSRFITTSSALVRCRNLLGGPSVGFRRYRSLQCIYIPLDLDLRLNVGVYQWLQICIVNSDSGFVSWSRVSFASWSFISFLSMPQRPGTQQKRTRVPLSLNDQWIFMIWQMRGFSVSSTSIACKQDIKSE